MKTHFISLPGSLPLSYEAPYRSEQESSIYADEAPAESLLSFEVKLAIVLLLGISGLFAWTGADTQARLAQTQGPAKIEAQYATITPLQNRSDSSDRPLSLESSQSPQR